MSATIASARGESRHNCHVTPLADRVAATIRRHDLIPPGGEVTCLVSGGADSTCLWHVLGELGYRVSAVHVLRVRCLGYSSISA